MCVCVSSIALTLHVVSSPCLFLRSAFKDLSQLLSLLDQELVSSVLPKEKAPTSTTAGQER